MKKVLKSRGQASSASAVDLKGCKLVRLGFLTHTGT